MSKCSHEAYFSCMAPKEVEPCTDIPEPDTHDVKHSLTFRYLLLATAFRRENKNCFPFQHSCDKANTTTETSDIGAGWGKKQFKLKIKLPDGISEALSLKSWAQGELEKKQPEWWKALTQVEESSWGYWMTALLGSSEASITQHMSRICPHPDGLNW